MASYNHCTLLGNTCRDQELRYTAKGTAIASVGLAVNRKWKDQQGEMQEEVCFIDCTAFGRTAEVIGQYVKKGDPLLLGGRLKQESWEDKQIGQKRSKIVVIIESIQLMGSRNVGVGDGRQPARSSAPPQQQGQQDNSSEPAQDDDVPF